MPTDLFTVEEFRALRETLHFPDILGYMEYPIHLGQAMYVNEKEARECREAANEEEFEEDKLWQLEQAQMHDEDYQKVAAFSKHVQQRLRDKRGF